MNPTFYYIAKNTSTSNNIQVNLEYIKVELPSSIFRRSPFGHASETQQDLKLWHVNMFSAWICYSQSHKVATLSNISKVKVQI